MESRTKLISDRYLLKIHLFIKFISWLNLFQNAFTFSFWLSGNKDIIILFSGGGNAIQEAVWRHPDWEKQVQATMYTGILCVHCTYTSIIQCTQVFYAYTAHPQALYNVHRYFMRTLYIHKHYKMDTGILCVHCTSTSIIKWTQVFYAYTVHTQALCNGHRYFMRTLHIHKNYTMYTGILCVHCTYKTIIQLFTGILCVHCTYTVIIQWTQVFYAYTVHTKALYNVHRNFFAYTVHSKYNVLYYTLMQLHIVHCCSCFLI